MPALEGAWQTLLVAVVLIAGCSRGKDARPPKADSLQGDAVQQAAAPTPAGALELLFTYGSEKVKWIQETTAAFNAAGVKSSAGKPIFVRAVAMGSGECIDGLLSGESKAHLTSPASVAFIELGNSQSRAKTGQDLVGATQNLVLSPVVIAMWKPMAEAIGWGKKPIGWSDIQRLATSSGGWADHGQGQWGKFKFGHTHPEYSNSGLIAVLAQVYAATDKQAGLTLSDVELPQTGKYLEEIQGSLVHYGSSTGFFGRKMFAGGPEYLSAAVLYENMVIEANSAAERPVLPVVAIYPKEGSFWSDHPAGVVERPWVTDVHRQAAKSYIDYLLAKPQQQRALAFGFRPSDVEIPLDAPFDAAHGVNPKEPQTTLEVPKADVMNAVIQLWRQHKKKANIVLVFDTSSSMQQQNKIAAARDGAVELVRLLGDEDLLSLLAFSEKLNWGQQAAPMKSARQSAAQSIQSLFPTSGTALYDAVAAAHEYLAANPQADRITAIVVLTDGADTNSSLQLPDLLKKIQFDPEKHTTRIFTIGYGADAQLNVLKEIAEATQAKSFSGDKQNIREVFKEISTFF